MFEKITDINYKNGKINIITNFYNMYCYYKCCDNLDEKYKNLYDYYNIVKYTKLKNKYRDYWTGESLVSSGRVFNKCIRSSLLFDTGHSLLQVINAKPGTGPWIAGLI